MSKLLETLSQEYNAAYSVYLSAKSALDTAEKEFIRISTIVWNGNRSPQNDKMFSLAQDALNASRANLTGIENKLWYMSNQMRTEQENIWKSVETRRVLAIHSVISRGKALEQKLFKEAFPYAQSPYDGSPNMYKIYLMRYNDAVLPKNDFTNVSEQQVTMQYADELRELMGIYEKHKLEDNARAEKELSDLMKKHGTQ